MKFLRILPETCARTWCLFSSSTRNIAFGNGSITVAITSIASSFGFPESPFFFSSSRFAMFSQNARSKLRAVISILPGRSSHLFRPRQNPRSVRGDRDGVLEMSGRAAIRRFRRPLIAHPHIRTPRIHHRLDRDYHSFLQPRAAPRFAVIRQVRLVVHLRSDTMPDKFANHRKTVLLDQALHRITDIAEPVARAHLVNRTVERLSRHVQQLLPFRPALPARNRDRRIRVVPVHFHSEVDGYDVAFLQLPLRRRNPVNDLTVHRGAKDAGITPVPLERRLAGLSRDEPFGFFFKVHRGNARRQKLTQSLHHIVDYQSRAVHFFQLFRAAQMNRHDSSAPASRLKHSVKPAASLHPRS